MNSISETNSFDSSDSIRDDWRLATWSSWMISRVASMLKWMSWSADGSCQMAYDIVMETHHRLCWRCYRPFYWWCWTLGASRSPGRYSHENQLDANSTIENRRGSIQRFAQWQRGFWGRYRICHSLRLHRLDSRGGCRTCSAVGCKRSSRRTGSCRCRKARLNDINWSQIDHKLTGQSAALDHLSMNNAPLAL